MKYWQQLKEKYTIPLPEEASDEEVFEWYEKNKKQANYLLENYGSYSWRINELANTLRNEQISESHFRELVRYEFEDCFKDFLPKKKIKDKINALKSKLAAEKTEKVSKRLNTELIKDLEIKIQTLNDLL